MSARDPSRDRKTTSEEGGAAGTVRRAESRRAARKRPPSAAAHRGTPQGQAGPSRPSRSGTGADWEALIRAYHRLTQAFLAQPLVPPVAELDAFSALASRSHLSAHELVALHYAVLSALLASGQTDATGPGGAAHLALTNVLLRLMGEYRREGGDVASASGAR